MKARRSHSENQTALFTDLAPRQRRRRAPKTDLHFLPKRKRLTIQERFDDWIVHNPAILELYLKFARDADASGRRRYGIGAITERVRWHVEVETRGDQFKINNDFRAPLARLLVARDAHLKNLFEMRKRRSP